MRPSTAGRRPPQARLAGLGPSKVNDLGSTAPASAPAPAMPEQRRSAVNRACAAPDRGRAGLSGWMNGCRCGTALKAGSGGAATPIKRSGRT